MIQTFYLIQRMYVMLETRRDSYSSLQYPESPGFRGRVGQGAKDEGGTKRSKKGRKATYLGT